MISDRYNHAGVSSPWYLPKFVQPRFIYLISILPL